MLSSAWDGVKLAVLVAATVLTVTTGVDYVVREVRWVRSAPGGAVPGAGPSGREIDP